MRAGWMALTAPQRDRCVFDDARGAWTSECLAVRLTIATGKPFGFTRLLTEAGAPQKSPAMVLIRGELYQLVVTPVPAPRPIGWLAIGFSANDRLARNLGHLILLVDARVGVDAQRPRGRGPAASSVAVSYSAGWATLANQRRNSLH